MQLIVVKVFAADNKQHTFTQINFTAQKTAKPSGCEWTETTGKTKKSPFVDDAAETFEVALAVKIARLSQLQTENRN